MVVGGTIQQPTLKWWLEHLVGRVPCIFWAVLATDHVVTVYVLYLAINLIWLLEHLGYKYRQVFQLI